ncbi:hypothetical protein AVEN_73153-1 [Araneus ventricosus]|uniref:Uncharacterized protein n=1 Tax=Araneus ventricosus TaxID=182803 RepID=A0A4Y2J0Z8_ARAVE|nr:hypothetical protein AVEN_73153-1 [Araneus ventricosus]
MPPVETHGGNGGHYCNFYSFNDTNLLVCTGPYSSSLVESESLLPCGLSLIKPWWLGGRALVLGAVDPVLEIQSTMYVGLVLVKYVVVDQKSSRLCGVEVCRRFSAGSGVILDF